MVSRWMNVEFRYHNAMLEFIKENIWLEFRYA
uniref:Uncharacterized protein n=1 Tax=Arundo donax TaxID=35708 RepID=A0A0A8ZD11_ARUDO